jgi:polysaccharide deacetylase family protein (PEP-CTERM system associated)
MIHKLSIDFEEWFHPYLYRKSIPVSMWNNDISRIEYQTGLLLDLLKSSNTRATFFIVGWIAEHFPHLIENIASDGHEIGIHSYWHEPVYRQNDESFKEDLDLAINKIYSILKTETVIYRAPNFSISHKTSWCVKILKEFGIDYDSSLHKPSFHPDYGIQFKFPFEEFMKFNIQEFPVSTLSFGRFSFPFSGGAYFRYYPYYIIKNIINSFEANNKEILFYIHPWELDSNLPATKLSKAVEFRLHYGIKNHCQKFEKLINEFKFGTILSQNGCKNK